jgi:hypothetical protein
VIFSFIILLFNYVWSNNSITGNEEEKLVTQCGIYLGNLFGFKQGGSDQFDDVIFINIANDKELIEVNDYLGIPKGKIDITDREKIATFLDKSANRHKYILLDVIFDSIHRSKNDSLLEKALLNTSNIIIPSVYKNGLLINSFFKSNTGVSAYKKSIYTNRFVKYSFLDNDSIESIALKMRRDLKDSDISKNGMFYYDNGEISLNSIVLNHRIKPLRKYHDSGVQNFYDLGVDILASMTDNEIQSLVKDKIILIGDFEDKDLHPTIYGKIPGILINFNAYLALKNNEHIVPKHLILFLFAAYLFLSCFFIFNVDIKIINKIKNKLLSKNKNNKDSILIGKFKPKRLIILSFERYSEIGSLFIVLSVISFLIFGVYIEILRSTVFFGTFILIRDWFCTTKEIKDEGV